MDFITPAEFEDRMMKIKQSYSDDPEMAHRLMDELMCDVLIEHGYSVGVKTFKETSKWYA